MTNSYLESLAFKVQSANFHRQTAINAIENSIVYSKPLLVAGAEFIAMMSALHSCLDVLAQWINIEHDLELKESDVSLFKVINQIRDEDVKQQLLELKETTTYLDDFCNYNKHRNIVKVKQLFYFVSQFQPCEIYDIDEFKRNGREYSPQILDYQIHFQFNLVVNQLNNITGINLNEYNPDC